MRRKQFSSNCLSRRNFETAHTKNLIDFIYTSVAQNVQTTGEAISLHSTNEQSIIIRGAASWLLHFFSDNS
jgi:hypothetical protein